MLLILQNYFCSQVYLCPMQHSRTVQNIFQCSVKQQIIHLKYWISMAWSLKSISRVLSCLILASCGLGKFPHNRPCKSITKAIPFIQFPALAPISSAQRLHFMHLGPKISRVDCTLDQANNKRDPIPSSFTSQLFKNLHTTEFFSTCFHAKCQKRALCMIKIIRHKFMGCTLDNNISPSYKLTSTPLGVRNERF